MDVYNNPLLIMMVNLKNFELISFIDHVRILFIEKNIIEQLLRNSYPCPKAAFGIICKNATSGLGVYI